MTEEWRGKRIIELSGPEDYSPDDVATAFTSALARDVRAVAIPEGDWPRTLASFGFSPEVVQDWCEMLRGFNSGHIVFEGRGVETRRGRVTCEYAVGAIARLQGLVTEG
jgi:hypothetical protein